MNLTNHPITNQTKSSTRIINRFSQRIISSLPTRKPLKSDYEKPRTCESDFADNNNLQGVKKSRSPLVTSNSFHKTLNVKGETKKLPSMIPRSKSRKRTESENFKLVNAQKADDLNEKVESQREKRHKQPFRDGLHVPLDSGNESEEKKVTVKLVVSTTQKPLEEGSEIETTSLSLKSCEDLEFEEVKSKVSDLSYKDAQEVHQENKTTINLTQENDTSKNLTTENEFKEEEELETRRQERIIRNLYETIKHVTGPLLDNPKWSWSRAKKEQNKNDSGELPSDFVDAQQYYDHTMGEISEIWKDAVSLINSVRDHTLKLVENKSKTLDKEQVILEAEMLLLAIDFAINYSKVKTDFMVKSLRKHFEISESEKSNLEKFMESKSVAALYNNDDLASMAQTVKELNISVLKGEDLELE